MIIRRAQGEKRRGKIFFEYSQRTRSRRLWRALLVSLFEVVTKSAKVTNTRFTARGEILKYYNPHPIFSQPFLSPTSDILTTITKKVLVARATPNYVIYYIHSIWRHTARKLIIRPSTLLLTTLKARCLTGCLFTWYIKELSIYIIKMQAIKSNMRLEAARWHWWWCVRSACRKLLNYCGELMTRHTDALVCTWLARSSY
jgi:hypothetical protein